MRLSFNEIEGTALKAARGAGFSWGLAEEAGFAARWLAERGFDWLPPLLAACDAHLSGENANITMDGTRVSPAAGSRSLCPIQIGAWIADRRDLADGLILTSLRAPLLLLPFLDLLSAHCGTIALSLRPAGSDASASFRICRGDLWAEPLPASCVVDEALALIEQAPARLERGNVVRLARPAPTDPALADRLKGLEIRTYVPASHHSRVAGAGAGLSDND
ncbi:MAG: DUF3726 domain-containing protein [Hyphomicrobiales bacterium]|nr:MAG: DUF3726 domain-containing protein [Hyphomicrobiales bacterium]